MPNPEFAKGKRAEAELARVARALGLVATLSAGSKGPFDVSIGGRNVRYLVDVKCNRWAGPAARKRLARTTGPGDVAVLARRQDRIGWDYRIVRDDGTMSEIASEAPWFP